MGKKKLDSLIIVGIIFLAAYLRLYKLSDGMTFLGDQAWFYLSARDMLFSGEIPLVGITSSHTWLHQGPIWTYIVALIFSTFGFNPVNPGYFIAFLDIATIYVLYVVVRKMISMEVGIYSAILFTFSPFIVQQARMPYHTSLIPIFTLLFFYFIFRWLKGNIKYFPYTLFVGSILYNLELASVSIISIPFLLVVFGRIKHKKWAVSLLKDKLMLLRSTILILIPLTPIIIYDSANNFFQTVKFGGWILYSVLNGIVKVFSFDSVSKDAGVFVSQSIIYIQRLYFAHSDITAILLFAISIFYLLLMTFFRLVAKKSDIGLIVVTIWISISLISYIFMMTPSGAYIPVFSSGLIIALSYLVMMLRKKNIYFATILMIVILSGNLNWMYNNIFAKNNIRSVSEIRNVADKILVESKGRQYLLSGEGEGSQFLSFTMNYEYYTWWLGSPPVKKNADVKFVVKDGSSKVKLEMKIIK